MLHLAVLWNGPLSTLAGPSAEIVTGPFIAASARLFARPTDPYGHLVGLSRREKKSGVLLPFRATFRQPAIDSLVTCKF